MISVFWKETPSLYYRQVGDCYVTTREFRVVVPVYGYSINLDWLKLDKKGRLTLPARTVWDGASGPTIDGPSSMIGSLVHDMIYRLIRLALIAKSCKKVIDRWFYQRLLKDGMWEDRAFIWYRGVTRFGDSSTNPENEPKEQRAPVPFNEIEQQRMSVFPYLPIGKA